MTVSDREFNAMKRELAELRQAIAQRPTRGGGGGASTPTKRITIVSGNTLVTGQTGIKYSSTPITDVPSAYDPSVTSSFIDGIGRGVLYLDGVSQGYVLLVNDGTGGSAVNYDLLGGTEPDVTSPVAATKTLTVGGDPNTTVTAYVPDII